MSGADREDARGSSAGGELCPTEPPSPRDCRFRFRLTLEPSHAALNRAVRRVLELASSCGCARDGRADLEIATREALANAMIHGNLRQAGSRIHMRCYGEPDRGVLIAIRDEGHGFDPEGVPDPRRSERLHLHHGRGLLLMRELMDRVEHRKGGREVWMFKACSSNGTGCD